MTYGDLGGAGGPPSESSKVLTRWWSRNIWLGALRRGPEVSRFNLIRLGMVIGLLAVLAPPSVGSLDQVGGKVLSAARQVDPVDVLIGDGQGQGGDNPDNSGDRSGSAAAEAMRGSITVVLNRQAAALLAGNLEGFTGVADPANTTLREELRRRFASLRAMRVVGWSEAVTGKVQAESGGLYAAQVTMRYCFVVPGCTQVSAVVGTKWFRLANGDARLAELTASGAAAVGPRPWEVTELQVAIGGRVVVAGAKRWAGRLPGILAAAERAATVADRYAKWGAPPTRYLVFVAGPEEWSRWYGVNQAAWVAAYAMPLTSTHTEIVLNALRVTTSDTPEVLQHEFAHVVTLSGVQRSQPNTWWMVEGIAEYVQNHGVPIQRYRALWDGKRYVRGGGWNGSVVQTEPGPNASSSEANGRYAVAYLTVCRIAEQYGEARLMSFFDAVARRGISPQQASMTALGKPWEMVAEECSRYVRRILGS